MYVQGGCKSFTQEQAQFKIFPHLLIEKNNVSKTYFACLSLKDGPINQEVKVWRHFLCCCCSGFDSHNGLAVCGCVIIIIHSFIH